MHDVEVGALWRVREATFDDCDLTAAVLVLRRSRELTH